MQLLPQIILARELANKALSSAVIRPCALPICIITSANVQYHNSVSDYGDSIGTVLRFIRNDIFGEVAPCETEGTTREVDRKWHLDCPLLTKWHLVGGDTTDK